MSGKTFIMLEIGLKTVETPAITICIIGMFSLERMSKIETSFSEINNRYQDNKTDVNELVRLYFDTFHKYSDQKLKNGLDMN